MEEELGPVLRDQPFGRSSSARQGVGSDLAARAAADYEYADSCKEDGGLMCLLI
jgi:hypothetical protein